MTKKHFIAIADCIVNSCRYARLNEEQIKIIVKNFDSYLKTQNQNYDGKRFVEYIYDKLLAV